MQIKVIRLPENRGLGVARKVALENCSYDLVAMMDADDISRPYRFERQLVAFAEDRGLHVVGGQISEFVEDPSNPSGLRIVPVGDAEIKTYMGRRCPMNHMTVMLRRAFLDNVGGYMDWHYNEDYYLWIRMALAGGRFANVPEVLVDARTGKDMSARRGGWRYFSSEAEIQKLMFNEGMISLPRYIWNVVLRFGGEVLLPTTIRSAAFRLFRSQGEIASQKRYLGSKPGLRHCHEPFSVVLCVYNKDRIDYFQTALVSIIKQSVPPDEIVVVLDGPVEAGIEAIISRVKNMDVS